ncbi:hypothetical protein OG595_22440 [Streptomyces sp. NBC_01451]|nr:hypothetical protein [Streptomyces sp. NBC_01451]
MLRSVLVAAFSAVVAFGALSGLSVEKGDIRADSAWSRSTVTVALGDDTSAVDTTDDSAWS